MDAGLVAIFLLCLAALLLLLSLAWIVNKLAKRPVMNGAAIYFWLLVGAVLGMLAYQWSLPHVTERMAYYAGKSVAVVLPLLGLAFVLMRRFKARKSAAHQAEEK
jgi:hypothetical protein